MRIVLWALGAVLLIAAASYGWRIYQHQQRQAFCFEHYTKTADGSDEFVNTTLRCIDDGFIPEQYR